MTKYYMMKVSREGVQLYGGRREQRLLHRFRRQKLENGGGVL